MYWNTLRLFTLTILFFFAGQLHGRSQSWNSGAKIVIKAGPAARPAGPELIYLDTRPMIAAGKMKANGDDIRIARDCAGSQLLPYWLESGINSASTAIWFKCPAIGANDSLVVYLLYGNPSATSSSSFSGVFTQILTISASATVKDTLWEAEQVQLNSGVVITLDPEHPTGKLTIRAARVILQGQIIGNGVGYKAVFHSDGAGPGGGKRAQGGTTNGNGGGGGGSYGGLGGKGGYAEGGNGGALYGTISGTDIDKGSAGGASFQWASGGVDAQGGNGGGVVIIRGQSVDISGTIRVEGSKGQDQYYGGGGGSGGGILILSKVIKVTGNLSVRGGDGGKSLNSWVGGGGGGGGRIKALALWDLNFTSNPTLNGGIPGTQATAGQAGSLHKAVSAALPGFPVYQNEFQPYMLQDTLKGKHCPGDTLRVRLLGGGNKTIDSIQWWLGTDLALAGNEAQFSWPAKAMDSLQVRVHYKTACGAPDIDTLSWFKPEFAVVPQARFEVGPDTLVQKTELIYLNNASKDALSYTWDFGDGNTGTEANPVHSYYEDGIYPVTLKAHQTWCVDSFIQRIYVGQTSGTGTKRSSTLKILHFPGGNYRLLAQGWTPPIEVQITEITGRRVLQWTYSQESFIVLKEMAATVPLIIDVKDAAGNRESKLLTP